MFNIVGNEDAKSYWASIRSRDAMEDRTTDDFYKEYAGQFAIVGCHSTPDHAQHLALSEAELSTDVLKCFCAQYSIYRHHYLPDLEHRKQGERILKYWYTVAEKPNKPLHTMQIMSGNVPIPIDRKFLERARYYGLNVVSEFIRKSDNDPLFIEIKDTIRRFANVVTTFDNYEKIVKIISLLEGPLSQRPYKGDL
jgi:phage terminase small subunit